MVREPRFDEPTDHGELSYSAAHVGGAGIVGTVHDESQGGREMSEELFATVQIREGEREAVGQETEEGAALGADARRDEVVEEETEEPVHTTLLPCQSSADLAGASATNRSHG